MTSTIFSALSFLCVLACVIWTIRAANRLYDDYDRLMTLERAYKDYLDKWVDRFSAIVNTYADYQTTITVTNTRGKEND